MKSWPGEICEAFSLWRIFLNRFTDFRTFQTIFLKIREILNLLVFSMGILKTIFQAKNTKDNTLQGDPPTSGDYFTDTTFFSNIIMGCLAFSKNGGLGLIFGFTGFSQRLYTFWMLLTGTFEAKASAKATYFESALKLTQMHPPNAKHLFELFWELFCTRPCTKIKFKTLKGDS